MNNSITIGPIGSVGPIGLTGPVGVNGPIGTTGMNKIEYRRFLRIKKINKLEKIWEAIRVI